VIDGCNLLTGVYITSFLVDWSLINSLLLKLSAENLLTGNIPFEIGELVNLLYMSLGELSSC